MKAPQVVIIVLLSLSVAVDLLKHGEPKTGKYSFGTGLLAAAIWVAVLYWGGFFR